LTRRPHRGLRPPLWLQDPGLVRGARFRHRGDPALKRWNRTWKLELVEKTNPAWQDLYPSLFGLAPDPRVKPEYDGGGSVEALLKRLDDA